MHHKERVFMNRNKNSLLNSRAEVDRNDVLHELLNYDIMSPGVLEIIRTLKNEKVLQMHPYAITPPKDENGRWQTYVNTDKGRKKIVKTSENDLYQALVEHYLEDVNKNITLKDFYSEWMIKRSKSVNRVGTLRRNDQHWIKYYLSSDIIHIPLRKLTKEMIEDFFHESIKKFNLSKCELNNMKIILKGSLELACERKILSYNPFDKVKINYDLCRYVAKKSNKTQVYFKDEKGRLMQALEEELEENPDNTTPLAVKLIFQLGTRNGEIVATMWDDIEEDSIHIQRMEASDTDFEMVNNEISFTKPRNVIVNHLKRKNESEDRFLYLTPEALKILNQVKEINARMKYSEEAFIFRTEDGRTTRRQIAYCIEKACAKIGMPVKSAHDIRRTVASVLFINGVPLDEIRRFLGHKDEKTTLGYIYNPYEDEETKKLYDKALSI